MKAESKTTIVMLATVIIAMIAVTLIILDVQNNHKIIETSNCDQLFQIIKDRGNDTPPRHDKVVSKWVQMECWK